jgi:catechol 2,3-dioxygenase-like lactoylglutathione lyase family enzyme
MCLRWYPHERVRFDETTNPTKVSEIFMTARLTEKGLSLGIITRDHDAMIAFYGVLLALPHLRVLETERSTIEFFGVGSSALKLVRYHSTPSLSQISGEPGDATGLRYFTIRVTNLDEILTECDVAGVTVRWGKRPLPDGHGCFAMVVDPDGNLLELVQEVS